MADLTAIARMTTQRFSKNIERGVLMIWVLSQNEDHQVRFSFAPSEVFMTGDLSALGYEGHYWLLEDIARLSPGLFRRNLPVGCASRFDSAGHNHEPIRMVVHAIFERRTTTGHEMITTVDRYDEIVAANFSGAG